MIRLSLAETLLESKILFIRHKFAFLPAEWSSGAASELSKIHPYPTSESRFRQGISNQRESRFHGQQAEIGPYPKHNRTCPVAQDSVTRETFGDRVQFATNGNPKPNPIGGGATTEINLTKRGVTPFDLS